MINCILTPLGFVAQKLHPTEYAQGSVLLCSIIMIWFLVHSCNLFTHIYQVCFTGTGATICVSEVTVKNMGKTDWPSGPQAIPWATVEPDLCHHMASLGHSELTYCILITLYDIIFGGSTLVQVMACGHLGIKPLSNHCWFIGSWTLRNILPWNFKWNTKFSEIWNKIHKSSVKEINLKMLLPMCWPLCADLNVLRLLINYELNLAIDLLAGVPRLYWFWRHLSTFPKMLLWIDKKVGFVKINFGIFTGIYPINPLTLCHLVTWYAVIGLGQHWFR